MVLEQFTDLVTAWVIYFRREYTVRADDRVIVDAGANIGVFTLYAARMAPRARIVAIEPFPATRSRLEQTVAANGLGDRVAIQACALATADASRRMDEGLDGPSQSRGMLPPTAAGGVVVPALSLGTLFERERLGHVDLLKMDIEGGEHEVLAGVSRDVFNRIHRISLEYHPNGPKAALFETLLGAGFVLQRDLPVAPNSGVAEFSRPGS